MARLRCLLPWAICLACAGCGGGGSPRVLGAAGGSGAVVFARSCSACHSLVGNESLHRQGGDLLGYKMTRSQLLGFTRVMPTKPLSDAQLDAVVEYILRAQSRARP